MRTTIIVLCVSVCLSLCGCAEPGQFIGKVSEGIQCNEPIAAPGQPSPKRPPERDCRYWLSRQAYSRCSYTSGMEAWEIMISLSEPVNDNVNPGVLAMTG